MNPIVRKLYSEEELQKKIEECTRNHDGFKARKFYQGIISATYALALVYEILGDESSSRCFLERAVDEWNADPRQHVHSIYLNALRKLGKQEKALEEVLKNPCGWSIETLAINYEMMGKKNEATLLYSGLAMHAFELYRFSPPFWWPHLLQKTSSIWEKVERKEWATSYNMRALQAWFEVKDDTDRKLRTIEEAWLHEEVAYIHERAQRFNEALRYYRKAKAEYETAHEKEPVSVQANYCDGDGDRYYDFFSWQIPDLPYIHLSHDDYEENDLRRMKYRFLNLEQKTGGT
jgi:tetratricopeptide (TPR) repeat protein